MTAMTTTGGLANYGWEGSIAAKGDFGACWVAFTEMYLSLTLLKPRTPVSTGAKKENNIQH